jgi:hypothetical protein
MNITNQIESEQVITKTTSFGASVLQKIEEEPDFQALYENSDEDGELDPESFSLDRGWWYSCRICGGETRVHTRHPFCSYCGFSPRTTI